MADKKMAEAKMHYDALMEVLDSMGMALEEFKEEMAGTSEPAEMEQSPEEAEYVSEEDESEEEGASKPADKAKVALIVARMKGKMKG